MKILAIFLTAMILSSAPAFAQDCGSWKVGTTYVGAYGDGMVNKLTIKKIKRCNKVRVLYYVGPLGSFTGDQGTYTATIDENGRLTFWRNGKLVSYTPKDQSNPYANLAVVWGARSKNPSRNNVGSLAIAQ